MSSEMRSKFPTGNWAGLSDRSWSGDGHVGGAGGGGGGGLFACGMISSCYVAMAFGYLLALGTAAILPVLRLLGSISTERHPKGP